MTQTSFSYEEAQATGGERFVTPDVQAGRDDERLRIVQAEYDAEVDPGTKAALGRELDRIRVGSSGATGFSSGDAGNGPRASFSWDEAQYGPGGGRGVQGGPQTVEQAQARLPRRGGTRRESRPYVAEEPQSPPMAGVADEAGRLRDTFFSGVDNARAGVSTLRTGMLASGVQAKQRNIAEAEARGDYETAERLRAEMPGRVGKLSEVAAGAASDQADAQRGAAMVARPAVEAVMQARSFSDAWTAFKRAPYETISTIVAGSLPTTLPALAAAVVAGPMVGAATMGASSGIAEAGSSLGEFARDAGVDVTDPRALQAFFSDPQQLAAAMEYARQRAGIIGAFDAASGGIAGKTLAPALRSGMARQAINVPTQILAQGAMGAGGEAGAQIATKGRIDEPGQVFAEAVGEFGGAPGEVLAMGHEARRAALEQPRPTERRSAINDRLDDFAAEHGMKPSAVKAMRAQSEGVPLAGLVPFYKRAIGALKARGLVGGEVNDDTLAMLDDPLADNPDSPMRRGVDADGNPWEIPAGSAPPVLQDEATIEPDPAPDPEWIAFEPGVGGRSIPREQLPQIKAEHRGAMVNFMRARGIEHETLVMDPGELRPTQDEFSASKVRQAAGFIGGDRSVLVSADNHILDGHHQWLARLADRRPMKVIRLNAPIDELVRVAHEFPSSTTAQEQETDDETDAARDARAVRDGAPWLDHDGRRGAGPGGDAARMELDARAAGLDRQADGGPRADGVRPQTFSWNDALTPAAGPAATSPENRDETTRDDEGRTRQDRQHTTRAQNAAAHAQAAAGQAPRLIARAGSTAASAVNIELRPNERGTLTPYMADEPLLARATGAPLSIPAGATDLQAKQAIRKAGAVSDKIKFFAPTAGSFADAPAIGSTVNIDGQAYTVESAGSTTVRLKDGRGALRVVSPDSFTFAKATVTPPGPPARATFDTREAAERFLSEQRRAGGARQGRALPVATNDGRWTFARTGEPAFEQAERQRQQAVQAQERPTAPAPRQQAAQGDAQRQRVLKALHEHLASGGSLTTAIRKAGKALRADDKAQILDRSRALRGNGKRPSDAARLAVEQHIGEVMPDLVPTLREPEGNYTVRDDQATPDAERVREAEGESSPRGSALGEPTSGDRAPARGADLRSGTTGARVPSGRQVRALGVGRTLETAGAAALVGRRVRSADDVAEAAQVYRNPQYESFRILFTKGDEIVHATGVSMRLPGVTAAFPLGKSTSEGMQWLAETKAASGADGFFLLHNHPGGDPTPSRADVGLTRAIAANVPGMKGHIIINSGRYAVLDGAGESILRPLRNPPAEDALLKPSVPHSLLGARIDNPTKVAFIAKGAQSQPDMVVLIAHNSMVGVRGIFEVPARLFKTPAVAMATLRRYGRMSGAQDMFIYGARGDFAQDLPDRLVREAFARDIVYSDGGASQALFTPQEANRLYGRDLTQGGTVLRESGRDEYTPASEERAEAKDSAIANAGRTLAHYRGMTLQALGRRQLVELYEGDIPQLRAYSDFVQQMDADKNDAQAQADNIARDWARLKDEQMLARLMHDATLAGVDAAEDKPGPLHARFKALSAEAQAIYLRARDAYREHFDNVQQAIAERIERADMSSERRQRLLQRLADNLKELTEGVYFPLARFGDYVVIVRNAAGEAISVSRAENLNEAEALRRSLLRQFKDEPGSTVSKVLKSREFNSKSEGVSTGFLGELYQALEKEGVSSGLMDDIGQLYLQSLPDLSWAKHGIHRKNTPGFSQDARRAFANYVFHGASHLAKLRYADRLQAELDAMQKHVDAQADDKAFDSVKAQQVVDEMVKRHEQLMNPRTHPVSTALTSLGFVFHLGLSPASAMVNLAQTPLVAYPLAGAKWGYAQASKEFTKASAEIAAHGGSLGKSLKGDEADAYREAVRIGLIDVTLAHDLAGVAAGEDAGVHWKLRPVMRVASWMFHHAERINRETTFIAGYRLARKAGAEAKKALDQAVQFTYDSHFDYSSANRPRIMQGNWQRVILLFKQFSQNMVFTLARQAQLSLKGADPAERTRARKALAGLLVMHASAAGVLGLPLVGTLLEAASMIGSDEDEPWDAETALRNLLADAFGQKTAEVLARGLSRLTPWDISGRVGLDRLILPDVNEGLEGQQAVQAWFASALGPVAGIAMNAGKGLKDIGEGRWLLGLEEMMPAALRGPMRAYRLATEGAQDRAGVSIVEKVENAAIVGQVLGLSPSALRNAQEGRSAVIKADRSLSERRSQLIHDYARAEMADDGKAMDRANDAIDRWNDKQPERDISGRDLNRSVKTRQRRIDEAEDGVYLPRSHEDARAAGRFAHEAPDPDDDEHDTE